MADISDDVAQLRRAVDALGLTASDGALVQLLAYRDLLTRWNRVYNLTALRDRESMLTHHLIDCLSVVRPLERELESRAMLAPRIADVGSGGGLPGVLLAVLRPAWRVTCVDSVGKKTAFVRQVAAELGLPNLAAWNGQAQAWREGEGTANVVVSRAFASLIDFTTWTRHLLSPSGIWMAMKGKHPQDELEQLPSTVHVFHVEQLTPPGVDADRCLVWMRPGDA